MTLFHQAFIDFTIQVNELVRRLSNEQIEHIKCLTRRLSYTLSYLLMNETSCPHWTFSSSSIPNEHNAMKLKWKMSFPSLICLGR